MKKPSMYDRRTILQKIFGYCNCPMHKRHWFIYPKTIRMNTMYEEESSNYITCCEEYYENEVKSYWDERWEEYYSSRL